MTIVMTMDTIIRTVSASEFKAKCLKLMDEVAETRQPIAITKRGKVVARLMPPAPSRSLYGFMEGRMQILCDPDEGTDEAWDAETA